jgi:hypothetical protein
VKRQLRAVISVMLVLLISAPISIVVTLLLTPLWRWIEASSGFESIGHSGPAEWCYLAVFALVVLGSLLVLWMLQGRRQSDVART